MAYFADTSAVAKLYLPEPGSRWLQGLDLSSLAVSALAIPETASMLARLSRAGRLDESLAAHVWRTFHTDLRRWTVIDLQKALLTRAVAILRNRALPVGLRTLDALQLASALEAQRRARQAGLAPLIFLTADDRLETAARHFELPADNPNRHA